MDVSKEAKSILDKVLGDVSKTSATKQIIIGTTSGWYLFINYFIHTQVAFLLNIYLLHYSDCFKKFEIKLQNKVLNLKFLNFKNQN